MSHPNPSHERSNEYPEDNVTHYKKKRGTGKLSDTVNGWADRLRTPQEKALSKSQRRHEKKLKAAN